MTEATALPQSATQQRYITLWVPRILQMLAWLPTRILFMLFCRFRVYGREHVRQVAQDGPILFVANHESEFDPIAIRAALPLFWKRGPLCYVTAPLNTFSSSLFSWRGTLYGSSWFFALWGAYPTISGTGSYAHALAMHERLMIEHNASFLIFPEGGRIRADNTSAKIHGGAGYLANLEHVTVIPVAVHGFQNATLASFFGRSHKTFVSFGAPRTCANVGADTHKDDQYQQCAQALLADVYARIGHDILTQRRKHN